jgi:xanthine dehydrogenase YagR molybdenum-binding subunit
MHKDGKLQGWGMASGMWYSDTKPARAKAMLSDDGKLTISSATADIGTGTYTLMAQIAADTLGLSIENVVVQLGDTSLPLAPLQGGSHTAASIGMAVLRVCELVKKKIVGLAQQMSNSSLAGVSPDDVNFSDGNLYNTSDQSVGISISSILRHANVMHIKETATSIPNMLKQRNYAMNTHSAVFAEVTVDEQLGIVQVTRMVSAIAAGRIINPKTARSQILGGMVWGISTALQEESFMDHELGRFINHDLAEYHIPVNADIPSMEVIFVEEEDEIVNRLGIKGVGEIGLVGVAPAIANAIYHATGKRVKDFPITMDKLL